MNLARAAGLILAVIVVAGGFLLMQPSQRPMPDVAFTLSDGRILPSSSLRGKSVLVNFWSVSCETCLRDMPRLAAMYQELGGQRFELIGVAMSHDPPPAVIDVVQRMQPGYPIALDVHGELAGAFGDVKVTPTTFLIDPAGRIRYSSRGRLDETRIRATLLTL